LFMRIASRAFIAAVCAGLVVLNSPAVSRPLPGEREPKRYHDVRLPLPKPKLKSATQRPALPAPRERDRPVERVSLSARMRPAFGRPALVAEARKYMGTNPTDRQRLWCATFMNFVLAKVGYAGTNSDAAKSFAYYGRRISAPEVGAIAVLSRGRKGGHVGVVSGIDKSGNPIIISGNHNKRVGEAVYARSRVIAYVMPTERRAAPATVVAERGPASHPSSEPALESPITELLAAIEAEQARAEAKRPAQTAPVPPQRQPAPEIQPQPVVPQRMVQQTAEPVSQAPSRTVQPRGGAQTGVSDPFSELFERIERAPARQPQTRPRHAGRVAAADTGRAVR
jgi:uncharacterized protein (TIGR02594 family)